MKFIEENSDSESSGDEVGYEYVEPTCIHGDAHDPTEDIENVPSDNSEEADTGLRLKEVHIGSPTDYQYGVTGKETETQNVSIESGLSLIPESEREETALKEVSIDEGLVSGTENREYRTEETAVKEESIDRRLGSGTERRESRTDESLAAADYVDDETEETEEKEACTVRKEPKPPPRPEQRRSARQRKTPAWFDSYQMNQLVARPYDNRLESLNILLNS